MLKTDAAHVSVLTSDKCCHCDRTLKFKSPATGRNGVRAGGRSLLSKNGPASKNVVSSAQPTAEILVENPVIQNDTV